MTVRPLDARAKSGFACVVLTRGAVRFHAGVAYRAESVGELRILHLADHHRVASSSPNNAPWVEVPPGLDPVEQSVIVAGCLKLAKKLPMIPYGLRPDGTFDDDGGYIPGAEGTGMTCASFIQKVFAWIGVSTVAEETWQSRVSDRRDQQGLVDYLSSRPHASPAHVEAVAKDVNCIRVRPEELAASTSSTDRPVPFGWAEPAGACVGAKVEKLGLW